MGLPAQGHNVAARTAHGCGVDVGAVEFDGSAARGKRRPDGTGPAAQIDDDRCGAASPARLLAPCVQEHSRLPDEEFRPSPRHEDSGSDGNAESAEFRPAQNVFKGQAGNPPAGHGLELLGRPGGVDQQAGFVFGENAPRRPKPGSEGLVRGILVRGMLAEYWHGSAFGSVSDAPT